MKRFDAVVLAALLATLGCSGKEATRNRGADSNQTASAQPGGNKIDADMALEIAKRDAIKEFKTLDNLKATVSEDVRGWRVTFEPKNPRANGGGPEYLLDKNTGEILSKIINQ